jgi:hypothetical protein
MADEVKAQSDSMKTVQALAVILIVILGIFMVTSLNKVKAELIRMNAQVDVLVQTTAQNSIGGFQAVDDSGKVMWKYAAIPVTSGPEGAGGALPMPPGPAGRGK